MARRSAHFAFAAKSIWVWALLDICGIGDATRALRTYPGGSSYNDRDAGRYKLRFLGIGSFCGFIPILVWRIAFDVFAETGGIGDCRVIVGAGSVGVPSEFACE